MTDKFRFPGFNRALTDIAVREIRRSLYNPSYTLEDLAKKYKVSINTIRRISDNKTYKDVK